MSFLHVRELRCWSRYISKRIFQKRFHEFRVLVLCGKH